MFVEVIGAAASAVALAGTSIGVGRWWRTRRVHRLLTMWVGKLLRYDRRIVALVGELDVAFDAGVGWTGHSIWPHELGGRIAYFDGLIDDLERARAELRAIDASGGTERLRADVERMAEVLRAAARTYRAGTIESYRDSNGAAIQYGASGRDVAPTLGSNSISEFGAVRDEFTLLARTVAYRLGEEDRAEGYRAIWPVFRGECVADIDKAWGGEPRPIL